MTDCRASPPLGVVAFLPPGCVLRFSDGSLRARQQFGFGTLLRILWRFAGDSGCCSLKQSIRRTQKAEAGAKSPHVYSLLAEVCCCCSLSLIEVRVSRKCCSLQQPRRKHGVMQWYPPVAQVESSVANCVCSLLSRVMFSAPSIWQL